MSTAMTVTPISAEGLFRFSSPAEVIAQMNAIEDELSRSAFNLFERRGSIPRSALEDWLGAEAALLKPVVVSIDEQNNEITVKADVPGFTPEQLKVSVEGKTLCICGKDEQSQKGSKNKNDGQESSTTTRRIHCKVALPSNVDPKKAAATLDKGVLTLKLPKVDASTQIQVKSIQ